MASKIDPKLKKEVLKIKKENPRMGAKGIFERIGFKFETSRKQISNILTHMPKLTSDSIIPGSIIELPPIPFDDEFSIPLGLYNILHDTFLDNDKKVEILKIMFPDEE